MRKIHIVFLTSYALSAGIANASTYYVAQNGNNDTPCTQARYESTPKQTIAAGLACLSAGDTLIIRGGTYNENIGESIPSGTSWSNMVRVASYPRETVRLAPTEAQHVLDFHNGSTHSYIEFDGLIFDAGVGTVSVTICLCNSDHHIRIKNSEVIGSPTAGNCANICGGTDSEFINLSVHGGGQGGTCGTPCANYAFDTGGSNNVIDGCDIYDMVMQGIQIYSHDISPNNNIIRNNRIHDIVRSADSVPGERFAGIQIAGGFNNQVYNNVIYNIGREDGGSGNAAISVYGGAAGTKLWNNTINAVNHNGIIINDAVADTIIQNNIIYRHTGSTIIDNGRGTVQSNNLLDTDPQFVDAANNNFNLQTSSRAINAALSLATVTTDAIGVARPQGGAPDIGAYEFDGSKTQPATPLLLRITN